MEVRVENRKETDEGSECDGHVLVQRRRIEHDACRERQAHRRPASTTFPRRCRDEDAAPLTHVSLHLCSRRGMREGRSTASTRVLRSLLHSKFLFTLFAFPFSLILLSFTVLTSTWLSYLTSELCGGIIVAVVVVAAPPSLACLVLESFGRRFWTNCRPWRTWDLQSSKKSRFVSRGKLKLNCDNGSKRLY